jgi:hypothetical protein
MSEQGCSDGNCCLRIEPVRGQHTNGGCRCLRDVPTQLRIAIQRKLQSQRNEIERLQAALAANICPECERIDEEDAWEEVATR